MPETDQNFRADEELTALIRQGDPQAFKELYFKYYDHLFRFAYYRTHSVETARDLVQDLFVRVWNKRKNLDSKKSIKSYLYRSLTNIIINLSNLQSSKNTSYSNLGEEESIEKTDIDTQIDLKSAVNELPEKQKTVFLLSRVEGFKYAEIAEILNISEKAVEKRMSKALNLLRKSFN